MFRRSADDESAASDPVRPRRVGTGEGVPRVSAVEREEKGEMSIIFLVMILMQLIFEFADSP